MKVTALNIHPLKGGRAIPLTSAAVRQDGLVGDRRFMIVEPNGQFISQREVQALAQIEAVPVDGGVRLSMNGQTLTAGFNPMRRLDVTVWGSDVSAALAEENVTEALTAWLGRPATLVHMDDDATRLVGEEWAGRPVPVGFADGFPVLITSTASLADLNVTLASLGQQPVGMDRFRTNILIDTQEPWDEDLWESVEIGGIVFDLVKPCSRCIMTTQDQTTGERTGGNPIQALAVKRMSADRRATGVMFGWNAVPRSEGTVNLGDDLTIVKLRQERWPMKIRG